MPKVEDKLWPDATAMIFEYGLTGVRYAIRKLQIGGLPRDGLLKMSKDLRVWNVEAC